MRKRSLSFFGATRLLPASRRISDSAQSNLIDFDLDLMGMVHRLIGVRDAAVVVGERGLQDLSAGEAVRVDHGAPSLARECGTLDPWMT